MTYIAFIGYSESEFKDFKIGKQSVTICKKEDYPDPSDFILKHSQKLGVEGETCVENIMNKVMKNTLFKDFELIPTHHVPHEGDYLFMNKLLNICFLLECKNKQTISQKEDLQKFENDIKNVSSKYKTKTIGVFLQLGNNKITNHESIELNPNTIYLTKDYINRSCLEVLFSHYIRMSTKDENISSDLSFVKQSIEQLREMTKKNIHEMKVLNKVISRSERSIESLKRVIIDINSKNECIEKIITMYEESEKAKEILDNEDSLASLESIDDVFNLPVNNDAQSCLNTKKTNDKDKTELFKQLVKDTNRPTTLTKKWLTKQYPKYVYYISHTNLDTIRKEFKIYKDSVSTTRK